MPNIYNNLHKSFLLLLRRRKKSELFNVHAVIYLLKYRGKAAKNTKETRKKMMQIENNDNHGRVKKELKRGKIQNKEVGSTLGHARARQHDFFFLFLSGRGLNVTDFFLRFSFLLLLLVECSLVLPQTPAGRLRKFIFMYFQWDFLLRCLL